MKQSLALSSTLLLVLTGCSTNQHMLEPFYEKGQEVSPERSAAYRSSRVDPVCGRLVSFPGGPWRSFHQGVDYVFDRESCKARFDADPALYEAR